MNATNLTLAKPLVDVTWLVEKSYLWLRGYLGSININKKTLVDDRFLL